MADSVDILFINPGDRKQIYDGLGDEFWAVLEDVELPDKWRDFSKNGYNATPLRTQFCAAAEILAFRDNALDQYFTSSTYLNVMKEKFGQDVVDHIARVVSIPLSRKLLEERTAA